MPLHYSLASLRQSTIPIGANVHGRPPASAVPTCLAKECLSATFLNFCVVRAKHLAQIVGTALARRRLRGSGRFELTERTTELTHRGRRHKEHLCVAPAATPTRATSFFRANTRAREARVGDPATGLRSFWEALPRASALG